MGAPAQPPSTLEEVLKADATLRDVCFVDDRQGWVVGDRGVVLRTDDGGKQWHRQSVPVGCSLLAVHFIDAKRGWIVGGDAAPLTHRTRGVVLRTLNGGIDWRQVSTPALPRLTQVEFFDAAHGIATGYGGAFYPSGLFASKDGGKSWQPIASGERTTWLAADFVDAENGAMAGEGNARGTLISRELKQTPHAAMENSTPLQMVLGERGTGWLVGARGRIEQTKDGGASWGPLATPPFRATVGRQIDCNTVALHSGHVWIAGTPGTQVFHSGDGGATWQAYATGIHSPIRRLQFIDARRGWAVGDWGTLLSTQDGGKTWKVQRAGGGRAALLVLSATPENAPLEIVSRLAAGEGYRTVVLPLLASREERPDHHRQRDAMVQCGGQLSRALWAGATLASSHHSGADLLAEMDRLSDGRAREQLHRRLVAAIRTWRPTVVLVPHQREGLEGGSWRAARSVLEQLALAAVTSVADPAEEIDLASTALLPAWKVERIVGLLPQGERGSLRMPTDNFVAALGGSPARQASPARGLLFTQPTVPPSIDELELLWQADGLSRPSRDLFTGLELPSGGDARRPRVATNPNDLDRLRRLTQKRRQLVRLLDHAQGSPAWSGQVVNLTGGLDPQSGGELLFQLANSYRETGRLPMAADTLYLLARRYPDHPFTEQALVWLVQYYTSGELANLAQREEMREMRTRPLANVDHPSKAPSSLPAMAQLPEAAGDAGGNLSPDERLERAALLGKYLQQSRPAVYAEPPIRFPLAVASRRRGFSSTADKYFLLASQSSMEGAWQRAARGERWLAEPTELPPEKPITSCRLVRERPHLDGRFDEALWKQAEPMRLSDGSGNRNSATRTTAEPVAQVRLCRDDEFLYVAISCPRLPGDGDESEGGARHRDSDLSSSDRVVLSLDIDRDYRTAYELTVDYRGQTHDAVWGDATWNPKWYVASQLSETEWTAEIAIPWPELSDPQPAIRDTWAVRAVRLAPDGRQKSWTGTTGDSPDSFGLLLFR